MSVKTKLKLIVGLIVTAVIVYFSVRTLGGLHPRTLLHSGINWWLVVISVAIYMYANYIRGLAYTRGIDPHLNHMIAFQIVGIGHTANMILPLHAGEGLRLAFFPSDYNTIRRTKLLAIPAYADFVAIMMLALLAVPFAGFKDPTLLKALWILSFISIAGVVLSLAIVFLVPRFRSYFNEFLNIGLVKMMIWVILSWILLLLSTWVGLVAFGFSAETSVRLSLAVFAATNIINFIPASPGAIGLFEYGAILGLGGLGIPQSTALAAGLLLHMIQYMALLPLGAVLYIAAAHGKLREAIGGKWHVKHHKGTKQ